MRLDRAIEAASLQLLREPNETNAGILAGYLDMQAKRASSEPQEPTEGDSAPVLPLGVLNAIRARRRPLGPSTANVHNDLLQTNGTRDAYTYERGEDGLLYAVGAFGRARVGIILEMVESEPDVSSTGGDRG